MKKAFIVFCIILTLACNNSKKDPQPATDTNTTATTDPVNTNTTTTAGSSGATYTVDGIEIKNYASILVSKDKDNLQAGAPFVCLLTSNAAANNNESLTLSFLLDTKPGTYPVVGTSFMRGKSPNDEMYGKILGGQPALTDHKVTITECKDLGSNNMGGHRWSISGTCEEITIKAMGIMLMDKSKGHPEEIKIQKISFTDLSFDDNWEEMLEKGMKQMKKSD